MKNDMKSQIMKQKANAVTMLVGGIIIDVFAGFCAVACLSSGLFPAAVFFLIFVVIGALLIKNSNTRKKMIAEYRQYVAALSEDPTHSIKNLSEKLGKDEETIKKRINQMIVMGIFADACVDEINDTVILGVNKNLQGCTASSSGRVNGNVNIMGAEAQNRAGTEAEEPEYIVVECAGCGAKTKLKKGEVGICEYCGSPLESNK